METIPKAEFGWIGGSNTWGMRFPEGLERPEVRVLEYVGPFETPFGKSAPFKLVEVAGKRGLRVAMHGCYPSKSEVILPWYSAKQIMWIFKEAGASWAITDGSVGGVQKADGSDLPPWSAVIPDDFVMDFVPQPESNFGGRMPRETAIFKRMAQPFCGGLRCHLIEAAYKQSAFVGVHDKAVYRCTQFGRFETAAEVELLKMLGKTVIVGQTVAHEAVAARKFGLHFASLNVVSNYAERGTEQWIGDLPNAMTEMYRACPVPAGNVLVDAILSVIREGIGSCRCHDYSLVGLDQFPVEGA